MQIETKEYRLSNETGYPENLILNTIRVHWTG